MSSKHLLVGNWKMNLGPKQGSSYARQLRESITALSRTDVWVAPPFASLPIVASELKGSLINVGAQNVHWTESGAFTGETAPSFLTELGATFSLTGHSERRTYFGETSEQVAQRTVAAINAGLTAIACIGETEAERSAGTTEKILEAQLNPILSSVAKESVEKLVLAYEPVWAIGTGKVASLDDIRGAHQFIQKVWSAHNLPGTATILYGGSVNPTNFAEILALKEVHGALVGGASIKLDQWMELIRISEAKAV
jgi:triosephosphate isomerase